MNYDLEMEKQMSSIEEGTPLLLHACCAPCTSGCLEHIANKFKISILFYNPNITEEVEYLKRLNELKRFVSEFKVKYPIEVIDGNYDKNFLEIPFGKMISYYAKNDEFYGYFDIVDEYTDIELSISLEKNLKMR